MFNHFSWRSVSFGFEIYFISGVVFCFQQSLTVTQNKQKLKICKTSVRKSHLIEKTTDILSFDIILFKLQTEGTLFTAL